MTASSRVSCVSIVAFFFTVIVSCGGPKGASVGPQSSTPAADFSLTAAPTTITLTAGEAGQSISVDALPTSGFTASVAVSLAGLPTGVTASPAQLSLIPGTAQNVVLTASESATAGPATLTLVGVSGVLSHSVTVAEVTSEPSPDFSITLSPSSETIVAGATGNPIVLTETALNGFANPVAVSITGLPPGVTANPTTLTLTAGVPQSATLTAAITAPSATSTVIFTGESGSLSHEIPLTLAVQSAAKTNVLDVTTYHYDVARDGLNANETILNLANVNSAHFGKIGFYSVDAKVDAEPLFLADVPIGGHFHNVLYVATEHDSVYAFDADSGIQMWKATILGSGETTSDDRGCTQITPEIGITATPVIDRNQGANGTLFAVGMSKDASGKYHQRLHALDVTTGIEANSPREITASYPGTGDNSQNGNVIFDPSQFAERAALLLLNGNIYTAWTSHCDQGLYTGWVIAYSESTLQQTQVLNVTPNGHEGSIWMSGDGLAADTSGNIYFLDANGTFDTTLSAQTFPTNGDYGNAMLKLSTSGGKLAVADYFEMYNTGTESADDIDLGSGGELLLPDQKDAAGAVHHLIVGAGKDRNIYLADRDNMGKFNPADNPQDSNIYQEITGQLSGPVFSSPAYFNGTLYYGPASDTLKAFPLNNAVLATSPSSHSAVQFPYPGTTPGISANGSQDGIVWAVESNLIKPGVLHAFDAANLAHELYNSGQAPNGRDSFGNGNKFITPMVANGKVYVGTPTGVAVFGLLP